MCRSLSLSTYQALSLDMKYNLGLSMHRLHLESVAAHKERHADVLDLSRMSEAERLVRQTMRCVLTTN
jgi:hypothetical protein